MSASKRNVVPTRLTAREFADLGRLQKQLSAQTGVEWSRSDVMRAGLEALKAKVAK